MKKEELKTDEFVILIDAAYLDEVGHSMNGYFSYIVKRKLPKADLPALVEGLALDAGIRPGDNHIQIILVYPKGMKTFSFCEPSDLNEELHCVAFRSNLGEFSFASYSTENLTTREELYSDFIQTLSVSQNTQKVMIVGDMELYGEDAVKALEQAKNREVYYFSVDMQKAANYSFKYCNLGFALLHAMGVRSEELE